MIVERNEQVTQAIQDGRLVWTSESLLLIDRRLNPVNHNRPIDSWETIVRITLPEDLGLGCVLLTPLRPSNSDIEQWVRKLLVEHLRTHPDSLEHV